MLPELASMGVVILKILEDEADDMVKTKTVEMVYIRTNRAAAVEQANRELREAATPPSRQPEISFL